MRLITQRSFSRNHFRAPISFIPCNGEEECAAVMLNSSVGGMYFEAPRALTPGEGLIVRLADFAPDPYWPEANDHYVGEVRWCVERPREPEPVYGVGIRFVASICRECGHMSLEPTSYTFGNVMDVCPECLEHIACLSEGGLKRSIRSHLMGNVL